MSNRVFLYCTNFESLPTPEEWDDFYRLSGVEYEANACIPIFWMCLFSFSDIQMVSSNHNGFEDDWRPYPYLMCNRVSGVDRLRARAAMMKEALGEQRFALYSEWLARMESEPYLNVLVRTEELDWMCQEGELEGNLRKAMRHLDKVCGEGAMRMSDAMNDIAGLWHQEILSECEASELVGCANSSIDWPKPFEVRTVGLTRVAPEKPKWWVFWRS